MTDRTPEPLRSTVLVVDDEQGPRESLRMILAPAHRVLQAASGAEALELLEREPVALVTVDLNMPGMAGIELVHAVRAGFPQVEIIVITGCGSVESAAEGIRCGISDYLQKPFDVVQVTTAVVRALTRHRARARLTAFLEELGRVVGADRATEAILEDLQMSRGLQGRLSQLLEARGQGLWPGEPAAKVEFLEVLAETIEARDPWMRGHARRVALMAGRLAEQVGLSTEEREQTRLAAFLHDLGKVGVRPTDPVQRAGEGAMEQHPALGAQLLEPLDLAPGVALAVRHHHEWWDGTGYPAGLAGEKIPLMARIISVADAFDAMQCERRYRRALDRTLVVGELRSFSGIQFDPRLVREFLVILESGKADAELELLTDTLHATPQPPAQAAG